MERIVKVDTSWHAGGKALSLEEVEGVARGQIGVQLCSDPEFIGRIQDSVDYLEYHMGQGPGVYGVTTGVGDSVTRSIPLNQTEDFSHRLLAFHGCGLGKYFSSEDGRAITAVRLANLVRGLSGVRPQVLELLVLLLEKNLVPRIPEEGSVGASGDLTPLSYLAAVLTGQRTVWWQGQVVDSTEALKQAGLLPLTLRPKEALAIMNGTAVMTALAARVWVRARKMANAACLVTALVSRTLEGNPHHFHPAIFRAKAHNGTVEAGHRIRAALEPLSSDPHTGRLQDTYALRCAPHVLGVLIDTLEWSRPWIEIEINGASDNPLLDPSEPRPLHGGNFYGGHIGLAMEALKNAVAQVADLLDRQVHLLLDEKSSRGLPANLSGAPEALRTVNHGLKALGIAASAWAAEALKTSLPSTIFSRSTESHNQDKVSLGTLAARDGVRVMVLSEQVLAAALVSGSQAAYLRGAPMPKGLQPLVVWIQKICPPVIEDRALEDELRGLLAALPDYDFS